MSKSKDVLSDANELEKQLLQSLKEGKEELLLLEKVSKFRKELLRREEIPFFEKRDLAYRLIEAESQCLRAQGLPEDTVVLSLAEAKEISIKQHIEAEKRRSWSASGKQNFLQIHLEKLLEGCSKELPFNRAEIQLELGLVKHYATQAEKAEREFLQHIFHFCELKLLRKEIKLLTKQKRNYESLQNYQLENLTEEITIDRSQQISQLGLFIKELIANYQTQLESSIQVLSCLTPEEIQHTKLMPLIIEEMAYAGKIAPMPAGQENFVTHTLFPLLQAKQQKLLVSDSEVKTYHTGIAAKPFQIILIPFKSDQELNSIIEMAVTAAKVPHIILLEKAMHNPYLFQGATVKGVKQTQYTGTEKLSFNSEIGFRHLWEVVVKKGLFTTEKKWIEVFEKGNGTLEEIASALVAYEAKHQALKHPLLLLVHQADTAKCFMEHYTVKMMNQTIEERKRNKTILENECPQERHHYSNRRLEVPRSIGRL